MPSRVRELQPPELVERRIELALCMLALGAWVFPLAYGSKMPLIPKAKGGHGFLDASPDPDRARTFLSNPGQPNYGVVFPDGSDVIVLDLDGGSEDRPGWREDWQRLYELHGPPGLSFIVKTPSDGRHAYYRWRIDLYGPIPPGDEMLGWTVRKPWKGYLVGPGSIVDGTPYELVGVEHILDLPEPWVRAALAEHQSDTIHIGGQRDPADVPVGQRHAYLRDIARLYAGTVRDPEALFAAVWTKNLALVEPKTEDEVRRAIGDVLVRFPADPVEEDPETGAVQVARADGEPPMMSPTDDETLFPPAPGPVAYDGLLGECTAFLLDGTDASPIAILASLVSFCGALVPCWGYWHGRHTSSPFLALVGKTGIGRKGTAMYRVRDALGYTLGMDTVNRTRFDGIASGEALVKALLDRSQQTFGVPTGVLFEEEYATFLAASGREGSNLDARMRSAFDGKQLAHRKVGETIFVPEPYYLSGLVGITPEELQAKVSRSSFKNGSGNRWLWLPVVRRDVRVVSSEPIFPIEISEALLEAHRATFRTPVRIVPGPGVDDLLGEYDDFLRAESVGLAADMTRRYGVIAFRIGLVHAAVERSELVTADHIHRAIALTEYGRAGLGFCFGDALGDASATHLLRMLLEAEDGTLPQWTISKYFIRDPIKRQAAIDDLCRLGVAEVAKTRTRGRMGSVLRLVPRKRDFRDFCALIGIEPNHEAQASQAWPSVRRSAQKQRRSGAEASAEGAQKAQKSSTERVVDHTTGEVQETGTAEWAADGSCPVETYTAHAFDHHRGADGLWFCTACREARGEGQTP